MKLNAANERIKRDYFAYLKEAMGRDEATIDGVARSLARFEASTGRKDFKRFHREQAVAFKRQLGDASNARTGEQLSKATVLATLRDLRAFFFWLAHLPGFKSHVAYADADYFNLSDKQVAIARARRDKPVPTLAKVELVLAAMPAENQIQRRDQALIAFAMLTGARVGALGSFRLRDIDVITGSVDQDARHVQTKASKSFLTYFMPVSDLARSIVDAWHGELSADLLRGPDDPLFPATELSLDETGNFAPSRLARHGWSTTSPIREIFRRAFESAGLPYFNPHSFRDMLVRYAMTLDLAPEAMKAWSQNLGHTEVMTTFTSYGSVPTHRQGELIRAAGPKATRGDGHASDQVAALEAVLAMVKRGTTIPAQRSD